MPSTSRVQLMTFQGSFTLRNKCSFPALRCKQPANPFTLFVRVNSHERGLTLVPFLRSESLVQLVAPQTFKHFAPFLLLISRLWVVTNRVSLLVPVLSLAFPLPPQVLLPFLVRDGDEQFPVCATLISKFEECLAS